MQKKENNGDHVRERERERERECVSECVWERRYNVCAKANVRETENMRLLSVQEIK